MPTSDWMRLDHLLSALDEEILATPDSELVSLAAPDEVADLRARVLRSTLRATAPARRRTGRAVRLPSDPAERRALLKIMLARPAAPRLAASFSSGRDLADKDVEALLRRLLKSGELNDPE